MKIKIFLLWNAIKLLAVNAQSCERGFNIDFSDAILAVNTLHETGGMLRFENLGTYDSKEVDLVVTVKPGTDYTTPDSDLNGLSGYFGQINVQNRPGAEPNLDGVGEFDFCFQDHASSESLMINSFDFTIFDLDSRGDRGYEEFSIDPSQFSSFQAPGQGTAVAVQCCQSTQQPPCMENEKLCFISNASGNAGDNPNDPNNLTPEQQRRSVLFTFQNKACWQASFSQVCNDGSGTCSIGGNLIFAGTASQLENCEEPETRNPVASPTLNPTKEPTKTPVSDPTQAPTPNPTSKPTSSPTRQPIEFGATSFPTEIPTRFITEPPFTGTGASLKSKGVKGSKKDKKPYTSKKYPKLVDSEDENQKRPKGKGGSEKGPKMSKKQSSKGGSLDILVPIDSEDILVPVDTEDILVPVDTEDILDPADSDEEDGSKGQPSVDEPQYDSGDFIDQIIYGDSEDMYVNKQKAGKKRRRQLLPFKPQKSL